jgi:enoyl-CoA hydratase/carnithine racemase
MDFSSYSTLAFERRDRVLTIACNRPDSLNAVDAAMHRELARVFDEATADPDSDVIVLTGRGRAFCAGGDLDWMQDAIDNPQNFDTATVEEAKQIVGGLLDCDKPVICRMNGDAIGLGATLALFCDIILADESARIGDPHVRVGLVAGDGGAVIWPQLIGFARAKEFLMTGDLLSAERAEEIGLINHAIATDQLDERVAALADKLARGATKSIRWSKRVINIPLKHLATSMMDASLAYESLSNRSEDHAEAVRAFAEKRRPEFTGQ